MALSDKDFALSEPPRRLHLGYDGPPRVLAHIAFGFGLSSFSLAIASWLWAEQLGVVAYVGGVVTVLTATAYRCIVHTRQSRPRFLNHLPTERELYLGAMLGFAALALGAYVVANRVPVVL